MLLGEVIDIKHGYAFEGRYFSDEPPGDVLLTPGNFAIGGGFKADKFKYYNGPIPEDFVLAEGDLIVTMTDLSKQADTLGYPALIPRSDGPRFLHNQRLGKIVIHDDRLDKEFLYYVLCSNRYRNEVLASATGTTVKHTSPNRIKAFRFAAPPLEEQRAIARVLGTLDDKIELNRRMNETLEAMAQALFKFSFVDATRNGLPERWHERTLVEEFDITMGQSPPGESYNETGDGLPFFQGRSDFGFRYPKLRVFCTSPTRLAKAGDTLVSVRAPVGSMNIAAEASCVGRGVAAVCHKTGFRSYTYYLIKSLQSEFERFEAEGTVFGSINKADFGKIGCVAPPFEVIEAYENLVAPIDQRIENNERESRTLAALREALLPKLLSGKVCVRALTKRV